VWLPDFVMTTLRSQYPNIMLRVMRAMRTYEIQLTSYGLRYVQLYCASVNMSPDGVAPFPVGLHCGCLARRYTSFVMTHLLHDFHHLGEDIHGFAPMSTRLKEQTVLVTLARVV
jgi:hypothetical protein